MTTNVTLADVAKQAGVSLATASRVLNNDSGRDVRPKLKEKVLAAAAELNYVPNAHAQALARSRSRTVGVLVHDMSDPYFSEILRGIQQASANHDRLIMVCNSYRDPEREMEYVRLLHAQRVEVLILAGGGLDNITYTQNMQQVLKAFAQADGRFAFIGRHQIPGNAIVPDNFGGARLLGQALIDAGHRKIGVISGPKLLTTTHDRLDGFKNALQEKDIPLPETQIVNGNFSRESGAEAVEELLAKAPDITVVVALNDPMAVGAMTALRARGLSVPDDISIAGYDDIPVTQDVYPQLTTVHVPMVDMGARAVELAFEADASKFRIEHIPVKLVWRGSVKTLN